MSTRCTISYDDTFHLYEECFDNHNVYLELSGPGWDASISTGEVDWRDGDITRPKACVKMDITLWRKIVDGWMKSHWGTNPGRDHASIAQEEWSRPLWLSGKKAQDDE